MLRNLNNFVLSLFGINKEKLQDEVANNILLKLIEEGRIKPFSSNPEQTYLEYKVRQS